MSDEQPEHEQESSEQRSRYAGMPRVTRIEETEPGQGRTTVGILAALLLVAVVAAVALGFMWNRADNEADELQRSIDAGVSAEGAARDILTDMMTYSHESLDEDFAWLEEDLEPEFAEQYRSNVDSIKKFVAERKLSYTGTVVDLAPRVEGENQVVVLAFVDQDVVDAEGNPTGSDEYRVRLVLTREGKGADWIVENIEILGGQNAV